MEHWEILKGGQVVTSTDAEELFEIACSYFKWCDDNPIESNKMLLSGKTGGTTTKFKQRRPYTVKGLCLHCGITEEYLKDMILLKEKGTDYYFTVTRILYIIHTQILENSMIGEFSPVLASKILGMDKEEQTSQAVRIEIIGDLPALGNSESEILEKLKQERPEFNDPTSENSEKDS